MYFHDSLIPRGAYFLLPLESKQEATSGSNFTKCFSDVTVNQLKVKHMHVRMGIFTFKQLLTKYQNFTILPQISHFHKYRNFSSIFVIF